MKHLPVTKQKKTINLIAIPSLLLTNICHVSNKLDELHGIIGVNQPSAVLIMESWLSSKIPDSAIDIGCNYCLYHLDRPMPGGGVLA